MLDFGKRNLKFVLEIVTTGYRLPFISLPPPLFVRIHRSALEHSNFVHDSIKKLVQSHCVHKVLVCPNVCSPL